jgi:hypothetical protein
MAIGTKGIHTVNMIRTGLARATTTGVLKLGRLTLNFHMLTDREVKPLYDKVMGFLLTHRPYGEYLAIREIFGQDIATFVAKRGDVIPPPGGLAIADPPTLNGEGSSQDVNMPTNDDQMNVMELDSD